MVRPRKRRRVCKLPNHIEFKPSNMNPNNEEVILSIDEFEVFRLIDLEGLQQKETAERMEVARSTIQRMYAGTKNKIADAIVNGKVLKIEGGNYELCDLEDNHCPSCNRKRGRQGRRNRHGHRH